MDNAASKKQKAIIAYLKKDKNRFISSWEIGINVGKEITGQIQRKAWTNKACGILYKKGLILRSLWKSQWHYRIR